MRDIGLGALTMAHEPAADGRDYDICIVGDFRFPGGTSTAIAEEITIQAERGYRTGLIHRRSPVLGKRRPLHAAIRRCIDKGAASLVELSPAGLTRDELVVGALILHHPMVFTEPPQALPHINAEQAFMVIHQPPLNAEGTPYYDLERVQEVVADIVSFEVPWAPISALVREQLAEHGAGVALTPEDWVNVIDSARWRTPRARPYGARLVIGRHSRPDWRKWPDTRELALATLPPEDDFDVRILGGGAYLNERFAPIPYNWTVLGFGQMDVRRFLSELDAFVYFHHSSWIEAHGRNILEAMASGLPVVLGHAHRPVFGDAPIYAAPHQVLGQLRELVRDVEARSFYGQRAHAAAERDFGPARHLARLDALIGPPAKRARRAVAERVQARERVLMMTSNGIGVGHLTRLLAVARRLPTQLTPVFLTFSQARVVVERFGYIAEYLPFHRYIESSPEAWNLHLLEELDVIIDFYRPRVVVFDGNVPYRGLIEARARWPETRFVWVRRSMWSRHADAKLLRRASAFDMVIEPRDVAEAVDRGATVARRGETHRVDPVLLLDDEELLSREEARRALGLAANTFALMVQLGSGNNFDIAPIVDMIHEAVRRRARTETVVIEWMMTERPLRERAKMRILHDYPAAKYLKAFDAAVSAAGYNSYHELLAAGIPTLFVPNVEPSMDHQLGRANFAQSRGAALVLDPRERDELFGHVFGQLMDDATRRSMRERMSSLRFVNGAAQAAEAVATMAEQAREEDALNAESDRVS